MSDLPRGGWLEYRCRRCGEVVRKEAHVPNLLLALASISASGRTPDAWGGVPMGETAIHDKCRGGGMPGIGYADLQGGSLDAPTKIPDHPLELAAFRLLCASKRMERSGREEVAKRCRTIAAQLVARVHAKPEG